MKNKAFIEDYDKIVCFTEDGNADGLEVYSDGVRLDVSGVTVSPYDRQEIRIMLGARLNPEAPCFVTFGGKTVAAQPLGIYDSAEFGAKYNYDGPLGAAIEGDTTVFRVWAPFALAVRLNIYERGNDSPNLCGKLMTRADKGVWEARLGGDLDGKYYTYTMSYNGRADAETVDPYAFATGLNGKRGMVTDLRRGVTPDGWEGEHEEYKAGRVMKTYADAVIWEVHVRDFSGKTNAENRRKFLAFTERGLKNQYGMSVGLDYLSDLGITHVHLLPAAEYASVDQTRTDMFNWGYDPMNYNAPMGSYSSDPTDGRVAVLELRRAVQSLHNSGIGVVFDVVYNHTYNFEAPIALTVPHYYYRFDYRGNPTNGSGCGNETASERYMCRRFMVDSLMHWARTYHADGFRFDLMGLHDTETMSLIERALHEVDPLMLIYGEGWVGGATSLDGGRQCNKWNAGRIEATRGAAGGVAVFSDVMRDSVKGAVFNAYEGGYVNGRAYENVNLVKFSSMGATSPNFDTHWVAPAAWQVINYVSAHDNLALWDKLALSCGPADIDTRLRANRMCAAIVLTSRGVPFFQAGEEILRSKLSDGGGFDENSYKSPDAVNNIDWDKLAPNSPSAFMRDYYKGLIEFRKAHPSLRLTDTEEIENATNFIEGLRYDVIAYTLDACGESLYIVYNPLGSVELTLPEGRWSLRVSGEKAGDEELAIMSGRVTVPEKSVWCLVRVDAL